MPGRISNLGERSAAGESVADRYVPAVMDGERFKPRGAENLARGAESLSDRVARNVLTARPGIKDARNGSSHLAPARSRSDFHAAKSSSIPASHQSGTTRGPGMIRVAPAYGAISLMRSERIAAKPSTPIALSKMVPGSGTAVP